MHRDSPINIRLNLQQNADGNARRHMVRAMRRFVVLVASDIGAFFVMRSALRLVRDHAALGTSIAGSVAAVLPAGLLSGSQFVVGMLVGLVLTGNYGHGDERRNARRLFAGAALATGLPLWTILWTGGFELVAIQYGLTTLLVFLAVLGERLVIDRLVSWLDPERTRATPSLFVGAAAECRRALSDPGMTERAEYRPVGFVDLESPAASDALGSVVDFARLVRDLRVEAVLICGYLSDGYFHEVVDTGLAAGCRILSVPRAIEVAGVQPVVLKHAGRSLIELRAPRLNWQQLALKRLMDVLGAVSGLIIAAPVMAAVAVAIRLDSPGPVFFTQERVGTGGRRFRVFKFRTMYYGVSDAAHRELVGKMLRGDDAGAAHEGADGQPVFKLMGDSRVTKVGQFLRRTSLDELPQFINVLLGDMSLVGPRPPLPYEFEAYDRWQFDRLRVRPGITGLWQVSGRNRLTYQQMCELDIEYVRQWSLWLDFKIFFKTIPVVLSNSGSAA